MREQKRVRGKVEGRKTKRQEGEEEREGAKESGLKKS